MDWQTLIQELVSTGLTQAKVAELCDVQQSTISDLARIEGRAPRYELGDRLIRLHKTETARAARRDKAKAGA